MKIGIKIFMGINERSTKAMDSFSTPYSINFGFDTDVPMEENEN